MNFYEPAQVEAVARRERLSRAAAWAVGAAGLLACVILCTRVRTGNAQALLGTVVAVSVLAGWAVLVLALGVWQPSRALRSHMQGLAQETPRTLEGTLSLSPMVRLLPRSIAVRGVTLTGPEGEETLSVRAECARKLPVDGERVRVTVARSYVTAFEVLP